MILSRATLLRDLTITMRIYPVHRIVSSPMHFENSLLLSNALEADNEGSEARKFSRCDHTHLNYSHEPRHVMSGNDSNLAVLKFSLNLGAFPVSCNKIIFERSAYRELPPRQPNANP